MSRRTVPSVREILHPRSVAVFGASESKDKFGGRIMQYLVKHGFDGALVPINPRRDRVLGRRSYPTIRDAPGPVDVAILAVPPEALLPAVEECGQAGVGCCVILTIGFAETGTPEGAAAEARLGEISRAYGMRIIGPNCLGLIVPPRLALTSSVAMEVPALIPGAIGLVSQSGALMAWVHDRAHASGIGFSACVSLGNQVDVEICDIMEYLVDDPGTRAICLYVEGFKRPGRFLQAAAAARAAGKPVIMVKAGRTADGVRLARSHTASLAGDFAALGAACRECGALLTDDPDGMVQAADVLARWGRPRGDGIGLLSPSGGGVSIAADRLGEAGLRLAALAPATRRRLAALLPAAQADNPVDIGGRLSADVAAQAGRITAALAADPDVAANLVILSTTPFYAEATRAIARAALDSGKPTLVVVTPGRAADRPREVLREAGCPFYERMDDAIRILRVWRDYGRSLRRTPSSPPRRPAVPPAAARALAEAPSGRLAEPDAAALLRAYGIPVARGETARDRDAAVAAAERLGFPVAVKLVSRAVAHKSDAGGVRLDLRDAGAVAEAFDSVTAAARRTAPGDAVEGCYVQRMITGEAELIVGVRRDAQFGPLVLAGSGGLFAEIVRDTCAALAPVSPVRALEMLRELRMWPILDGTRGRPPLDAAAAAEVVSRMSWLAADLGARLVDLEANPVLVRRAGEGAVAVDARGTLQDGATAQDGATGGGHG